MKYWHQIISWVKQHRMETAVIVLLLVISLGLRLYKIDQYMTFLGDEGRDALIIKKTLTTGDIPLIGPPTSVGGMYLGPLYYYMMAVPMAVSWLNPIAAAVMVAFIGTASVGLVYLLAREWFGKVAALLAAILYSLSPINIIYSRSSWNPNPAPFFALILIWAINRYHQTKKGWWLLIQGGAMAFLVQMHYLALILLGIVWILWGFESWWLRKDWKKLKQFWRWCLGGIGVFAVLMSPLLVFDIRHDWMNFKALSMFFGDRQTTVNLNVFNTFERMLPIYYQDLIGRHMVSEITWLMWLVPILLLVPVIILIVKFIKTRQFEWRWLVLSGWMLGGVVGLALYKQSIYDHYLGFLNPAPYLMLAGMIGLAWQLKKFSLVARGLSLVLVAILVWVNIQSSPLNTKPNGQLERTQKIARMVIEEANGQPFNFALIAKHNYDAAYQFYLDVYGFKPKEVPKDITEQLLVVCEDQECLPVNHPKYEIAAFGWSKIVSEKEVDGIRIFKLVHNRPEAAR